MSEEPAGTVLLGSIEKRAYLYVVQTCERMRLEHANARQHGIQDPHDYVFVLDGHRFEISHEGLLSALLNARAQDLI
jgi:hypothetical protein